MSRQAILERKTDETRIGVELNLDGSGTYRIKTPIPFLTHMLEQLARHAKLDISIEAEGDIHVDGHHTTEDIGITLGKTIAKALGTRAGIRRFGSAIVPMDDACVLCALDLSGRSFMLWRIPLPKAKVGDFDSELAEVFFEGLVRAMGCNLHLRLLEGTVIHHIIEGSFKAFALALQQAVQIDSCSKQIPSTKGTLTD
ncbi:MAG: imidazoleglycerol-phosphate dehydratase HisB [Deltaproteobacteria bacterium]|nr:imidazoleglycerol-phosphate dehydratase HisB [Deltaproteobacteria bacterium]